MRFEADQPAKWSFRPGMPCGRLQAAGIPPTNPQVAKAIDYLLGRQQAFGGWMDPLQSFENFRTPFRETQMAVLALSAYFPQPGRAKGWNSPADRSAVERSGGAAASNWMRFGMRHRPPCAQQIEAAAQSPTMR